MQIRPLVLAVYIHIEAGMDAQGGILWPRKVDIELFIILKQSVINDVWPYGAPALTRRKDQPPA